MNLHKPFAIGIFAACLFSRPVLTQTTDVVSKFHLAQSFEQAGNFENAAKLYQELLARDPASYVYFDALQRTYQQLKRYDDAIALIQTRLAANPSEVNIRGLLGSVYYKAGREKEATAEWEQTIAFDPTNPSLYRMVAGVLLENRLLDKAADLYRRARTACNDPNLFTMDLAQLLATSMDYPNATREFIRWVRLNPTQLGFVQSRMGIFTGKEEGRLAAIEIVRRELGRDEDIRLYELLGWLYLEGKNFNNAFDVYKRIDRLSRSQGAGILAFADRAFKEGAYDVAAQAYLDAIKTPVTAERLPYAKFGYASVLKQLGARSDTLRWSPPPEQTPVTESQPRYAGAVAYFRRLIQEYPRSEFSARSYYQIGSIQYEVFSDLDGALSSFEQVEKEVPAGNAILFDVGLQIGKVLTTKGDTAQAAARYRAVANAPTATPDQQDEASYRLAELEYFRGRFQDAIQQLGDITINLKANYANDALLLQSFLQENKTTSEQALVQFARADFLARQHRNTEAIPLFLDVIERYPQALLVDDALMNVASLQSQAHLFNDAIASYQRLLDQFKESSIALDKAQFSIADIYQYGLRDPAKAIAAYTKFLEAYPQSLLVTQARERIRELRGDSL